MKYEAEIDGVHRVIQVERADLLVQASVDDHSYKITLAQPEPGVYLLFLGACVYEARVSSTEQNSFNVKIASRSFSVRIIDRKHRRIGSDGAAPGLQHLTAPMPGKVVRILTSQGAQVVAGQGVVVVEAMKMQNEVKAPKSGQLLEIKVKEGDTVTANQVLAIVE